MNWHQSANRSTAVAGVGVLAVAIAGAWLALPQASAAPGAGEGSKPVVTRSVCDSDAQTRAVHQVKLRDRGDQTGTRAIWSIENARPGSTWDYEVSLTVGDSEKVRSSSVVIQTDGTASFAMVNGTDGRAYAESGLGPSSGKQYCSTGLTATL